MPAGERAARQTGLTYLVLLWWVAISALMLAALGQQWQLASRRDREAELVFRAGQIQSALAAYRRNTPDGQATAPTRLDELLEDRRGPVLKRHLRSVWPDPVTGGPWGLLRDGEYIRGVYSLAKGKPLRAPEGVMSYEEWRFDAVATMP